MYKTNNRKVLIALLATITILLTACGSGGGSDSNSNDETNDPIQFNYLQVYLDASPYSSLTGIELDGGTAKFKEVYSSSFEALDSGSVSYSIAADGRTTIDGSNSAASTADESVIFNVGTDPFNEFGFSVLTEIDASATAASINGKYYCASMDVEPYVNFYSATFDGDGTGTYILIEDSAGVIPSTESFTYKVEDGVLSVTTDSTSRGGVTSDRNVLTLAQTSVGRDEGSTVCVKSSSGMSNSSLNGTYYSGIINQHPDTVFSSNVFNGTGGLDITELEKPLGGTTNYSITYSVESDGLVDMTIDGDTGYGAISPDGKVLIYSTPDAGFLGSLALGIFIKSE